MTSLERDLRLSIKLRKMEQAISLALPLLQKEYEVLAAGPSLRCHPFIADCIAQKAATYSEAIMDLEESLKPISQLIPPPSPENITPCDCQTCTPEQYRVELDEPILINWRQSVNARLEAK